jgi:glutamate-5-semialdehyde dehydrogenase
MSVQKLLQEAKAASAAMGRANSAAKNQALENIASELESSSQLIIAANQLDMTAAETNGVSLALQDRLRLDQARVSSLAIALRKIAQLEDPIGESVRGMTLANGLLVQQVRVPFGVIGCIYEARPNVTIDIAGLAIKSGNCAVLRGGSAAENTNKSLIGVIQAGLEKTGLPKSAVSTVDPFGRDGAVELMKANGLVDVLISSWVREPNQNSCHRIDSASD